MKSVFSLSVVYEKFTQGNSGFTFELAELAVNMTPLVQMMTHRGKGHEKDECLLLCAQNGACTQALCSPAGNNTCALLV